MAVTASKYKTYNIYCAASTNGFAQINHANSASGAFELSLHSSAFTKNNDQSAYSQLNAEISAANYVQGAGLHLANITFTIDSSGTAVFDADDIVVTASGLNMSAAYAVLSYQSGKTGDGALMFWVDFGQTFTAGDATTFNIEWAAGGIVQIK